MKNSEENLCKGKTIKFKTCNKKCGDNKYCIVHEYFNDYTDDMLNNLTLCKGCRKYKYLSEGETCQICKDRGKANREKDKEKLIICKFIDENNKSCTFKQDDKLKNGYCGKHQTYFWKEEQEKDGEHKTCSNFIRGCRNILQKDEEFSRCLDCRMKEREKDKERNKEKIIKRNENNKKIIVKSKKERKLNDILICSGCKASRNLYSFLEDETDIESELFKTCKICRDKDLLRNQDEERVQYKQEYEKKDDRIQYKKTWREENKDLMTKYYNEYRNKRLEEIGIDEYRKRCKENAKEWRKEHKDLLTEYYLKRKMNPKNKYYYYLNTAKNKGLEFNLTEEDCHELFKSECYYCGEESTDKLNIGIDRLDSNCDNGYNKENTVSCCMNCNMIKNTIPFNIFIKKIIHILSHNKLIDEENICINYEKKDGLSNYKTRFSKYQYKAKERSIEFLINENEFYNICREKCYICGVEPDNQKYFCGIDRLNSKLPYEFNNCKACCKECNIMKNKLEFNYFKNKLQTIYDNIIENNKYLENIKEYKTICNNTVLNKNQNKLSNETKLLIKEYDDEIKKKITILTNTDKELQKMKIEEYSKKENTDNRNNQKIKNYIETIIKPKAEKETKKYFEDIHSENPIISKKDDINVIRDLNKKIHIKNKIKKMNKEERKEYERKRKQEYRLKKSLENPPKQLKGGNTLDEIREYNKKRMQEYRNKKKDNDSDND